MDVHKLCGSNSDDVYALLSDSNWQLGMSFGLAHWNGQTWRWIDRFEEKWILDMKSDVVGGLYALDYDGFLLSRTPTAKWETRSIPHRGCNSMVIRNRNEIFVVGNGGAFFRLDDAECRRLETGSGEDLYCLYARQNDFLLCGKNGTLLAHDQKLCVPVDAATRNHLLSIDGAVDGPAFVVGGRGTVLSLSAKNRCTIVPTGLEADISAVAVTSSNEAMVFASGVGVFIWNGTSWRQSSLPKNALVWSLCTIAGTVVAYGQDGTILLRLSDWRRLPISLDEEYVAES